MEVGSPDTKHRDQPAITYTDTEGLYGGALSPDGDASLAYYGESFSMGEILIERKGKTKPSEAVSALIKKLDDAARKSVSSGVSVSVSDAGGSLGERT